METRDTSPQESYRNHYPVIAPLIMCSGIGDGKTTSCVMAQAATIDALRNGKTLKEPTDHMECACPILRRLAICLNDGNWWKDDMERTEVLRPLIPMLLDSKGTRELTLKRVFLAADNAVRVLTPIRLEYIAEHTKSEKLKANCLAGAKTIRELGEINSKESALAAREVCSGLRASASASTSASAYAYADAYASASASASASAYASADAYASASGQRLKYRGMLLDLFRAVAALKE